MKKDKKTLSVFWSEIALQRMGSEDFLSLTDIARYKNPLEPKDVVANRLRLHNTLQYLWLREKLHNPLFKGVEFEAFLQDSWNNSFTLSPTRWIENTKAVWIITKQGKWWWTFAHKDIAIKFANRISVEFELYLIKDYQRLKEKEYEKINRDVRRLITKTNYKIHTDAIKDNLTPKLLTTKQKLFIYADEADILNVALFWKTAKERSVEYHNLWWNMRDYATIEQLIVLSNMESINAELIRQYFSQSQRIEILNQTAIQQMKSLITNKTLDSL
jgi:KilA-N domain